MAGITLKGLKKSYGTAHVIKGVDIDIEDGEFVVFAGEVLIVHRHDFDAEVLGGHQSTVAGNDQAGEIGNSDCLPPSEVADVFGEQFDLPLRVGVRVARVGFQFPDRHEFVEGTPDFDSIGECAGFGRIIRHRRFGWCQRHG